MAVNVTEYINKFQHEGLAALRESQDASLKAMSSYRELSKEMSEKPGTMPTFENIPNPTQLVELSFGFASQMLEMRKAFTMRVAEMLVETQHQGEANFRSAAAASSAPASTHRRTAPRRK